VPTHLPLSHFESKSTLLPCMKAQSYPQGHLQKRQKGNVKCLAEQAQASSLGPFHDQPSDGANNTNDNTSMLDGWDPHMGLKPLALDDCGLDADIKMEDNLPYRAEDKVSSVMVDMMVNLNNGNAQDMDWLPPREKWKLAARKTGIISST
jgi:hypothetical protein